ncbi:MAG TPA: type II secretion system F family protein [Bryobacterales bacterium]|nr:type II secretion system F family protein [Bryobacterales bacterium]
MPPMIMITFAVVALSFLGFFLFVNRVFEKRETGKVRDRLLERVPTEKPSASAQPLFRHEDKEKKSLVHHILTGLKVDARLQELIEQAGLHWSSGRTALSMVILGISAFDIGWYLLPYFKIAALIPGVFFGALPFLYITRRRTKRLRRFEEQFPDGLEFVSRSMRAGHAFSVSMEMLHQEFSDPLGGEFRRTFDEQNLGLPLDLALEKLGKRVPLIDVQFFVSAVLLQKRTGGNLAEILDKLAGLIRERFKLRGQIRTISAQGRMSGLVLCLIPIVVGTIMLYVNPDHMRFFVEDPAGNWMAGLALGFQVLGFIVIRKIVNIEV